MVRCDSPGAGQELGSFDGGASPPWALVHSVELDMGEFGLQGRTNVTRRTGRRLVIATVVLGGTALVGVGPTLPTTGAVTPATTRGLESRLERPHSIVVGIDGYRSVPTGCRIVGRSTRVRPDATCTPGATNPNVNQGNIQSTICTHGWTSTIRPSSAWTGSLKVDQMAAWEITGNRSNIEEDHLVSLELGGAPKDSRNLWPEKGGIPNPKDRLENRLKGLVCSNQLSLTDAQVAIAGNWIQAYKQQFGSPPPVPTTTTTTTQPPPPTTSPGNGATALCRDGTYSYSKTHSGTCSGHGGVAVWYR